jgi:catechol 2,3-dioxygenase-like lactoylglutathione lyase family enzyme
MSTKLDMVGLVVEDMARSLAFYRELGFEFAAGAEQRPHVDVTLPGGMRIAWDTIVEVQTFDPDWEKPSGDSRIALAFLVENPSEVDATYERLVSAGYDGHKQPWDAHWGQRYASLRDPDGNGIDLFCPLE